jgi:hypothetical protein
VAVETVWEDGAASPKRGELSFSLQSMLPRQMPLAELPPVPSPARGDEPQSWWDAVREPVSIGDQYYEDALIERPGAEVVFETKGLFKTFSAGVGIGGRGADEGFQFTVLGDGKELWQSGSLKKADGLKPVTIDITGVRRLSLRVSRPAGERRFRVQAAWVDATLGR